MHAFIHQPEYFDAVPALMGSLSDCINDESTSGWYQWGMQLDIKTFLKRVYGLDVVKVETLNVEGKKKRSKRGFYRVTDYKKAYVTLRPPSPGSL